MKVNLQDFPLLHIGTYATTRQLGMGVRKETVLSSLMYVRERELYSVSYSLQRKVCLMVSSAILGSIASRCSGNEPAHLSLFSGRIERAPEIETSVSEQVPLL